MDNLWETEGVRLLMVGDVHVSDRPPSTRTSTYRVDILRKLIEIGELAVNAHAVVFVGDIFHSKTPKNTSHQTVRAVAQILQNYPRPVYILPGNHDYAGRHVESLAHHPLGTVGLMPNVTIFGTKSNPGAAPVGAFGYFAQLHGVREEEGLAAFEDADGCNVVVAHSAIFPPGQAPTVWEAWDARAVREVLPASVRVVWYGHIHEPHGNYEVDGVEFANFGAISRGSLHEEGALERRPSVAILTLSPDAWSIEEWELETARPGPDVFRVEEVFAERTGEAETNAFAEALQAAEVEVFSVERATEAISQHPGVEPAVRVRAVELIEEVAG